MKEILRNIFKKKSQIRNEKYSNEILPKIIQISNLIKSKENISFLHSGHLGDIINSLPVIKEISKKKLIYILKKIKKFQNMLFQRKIFKQYIFKRSANY